MNTSYQASSMTIQAHRAQLKTFEADGGRLAYIDEGLSDGKPIMLLHGMPTSSWLFRNVIPPLVNRGLRVIAPDMLGFGASDKPSDLTLYGFDRQAERLVALMKHLGLTRWTMLVHDIGGPCAWEVIDRRPEHIAGLILTNTVAYLDGWKPPLEVTVARSPLSPIMMNVLASRALGPTAVGVSFKQLTVHPENVSDEAVRGYWLSLHEGTTRAFLAFAKSFDWWPKQFDRHVAALRRLNVPAMTIWGKRDPILTWPKLPMQFARDLKIPDHRMHTLEDASHFLFEDKPADIARLVIDFMQV